MNIRPGTVSKILWHFTGGPLWDATTNRQLNKLKPADASYKALRSILDSKELRVGTYQEVVKVVVPKKKRYDPKTRTFESLTNHQVSVKSSAVCCVADIPLQHIAYHANRYGRFAIGFHRDSIVKAGFNPVMYTLEHTRLLNNIYQGFTAIDDTDTSAANGSLDDFESEVTDLLEENEIDEQPDAFGVRMALDEIDGATETIEKSYKDILAYIKTFDEKEFDSIYCEREWRSTKDFHFCEDDIAIVVLPKIEEGRCYYEEFLKKTSLPRKITIAAWEDLVEH